MTGFFLILCVKCCARIFTGINSSNPQTPKQSRHYCCYIFRSEIKVQRGSLTYSSLHSQKVEQPQQTGFSVDVLSSSWCCSASLRWHLYILAVSWDIMLASFLKPSQNTGTSSPPACSIQDGA